MAGKKKDPNEGLADDASLATDLGDEDERKAEQLAYYGGDNDDDIDLDENADRGDNIPDDKEDTDRGDEVDEESEESEEKSEDSEEEADDAEEEQVSADDDEEADAEDESADDDDQEDSEDDEVEEEDEEPAPKEKGIPRHRFNEVNERMRKAEAKIASLEAIDKAAEDAAVDKFDFDEAEESYMALLLDGKTKEAGAKRREIREAEKSEFKAEAVQESTASVSVTQMEQAVDSLSKEAERMFPAFDENSDDFNPQAVSKTLTFMRGYQADGMGADDAFVAALADTIEIFGLDTESQSDEESGDTAGKTGKTVTKKKAKADVKKKLDLAKKQGKSPAGEGKGSADVGAAVVDVETLTEDEIDALPAAQLARLRGDFI